MVFIYRNKKLYDIDEILYGANRKLYTKQMYIKQYINVGKVKYCKKKQKKKTVFITNMLLITENQICFNETICLDVSIKIFVQQHHNVY